jgi:hypothetical protein
MHLGVGVVIVVAAVLRHVHYVRGSPHFVAERRFGAAFVR